MSSNIPENDDWDDFVSVNDANQPAPAPSTSFATSSAGYPPAQGHIAQKQPKNDSFSQFASVMTNSLNNLPPSQQPQPKPDVRRNSLNSLVNNLPAASVPAVNSALLDAHGTNPHQTAPQSQNVKLSIFDEMVEMDMAVNNVDWDEFVEATPTSNAPQPQPQQQLQASQSVGSYPQSPTAASNPTGQYYSQQHSQPQQPQQQQQLYHQPHVSHQPFYGNQPPVQLTSVPNNIPMKDDEFDDFQSPTSPIMSAIPPISQFHTTTSTSVAMDDEFDEFQAPVAVSYPQSQSQSLPTVAVSSVPITATTTATHEEEEEDDFCDFQASTDATDGQQSGQPATITTSSSTASLSLSMSPPKLSTSGSGSGISSPVTPSQAGLSSPVRMPSNLSNPSLETVTLGSPNQPSAASLSTGGSKYDVFDDLELPTPPSAALSSMANGLQFDDNEFDDFIAPSQPSEGSGLLPPAPVSIAIPAVSAALLGSDDIEFDDFQSSPMAAPQSHSATATLSSAHSFHAFDGLIDSEDSPIAATAAAAVIPSSPLTTITPAQKETEEEDDFDDFIAPIAEEQSPSQQQPSSPSPVIADVSPETGGGIETLPIVSDSAPSDAFDAFDAFDELVVDQPSSAGALPLAESPIDGMNDFSDYTPTEQPRIDLPILANPSMAATNDFFDAVSVTVASTASVAATVGASQFDDEDFDDFMSPVNPQDHIRLPLPQPLPQSPTVTTTAPAPAPVPVSIAIPAVSAALLGSDDIEFDDFQSSPIAAPQSHPATLSSAHSFHAFDGLIDSEDSPIATATAAAAGMTLSSSPLTQTAVQTQPQLQQEGEGEEDFDDFIAPVSVSVPAMSVSQSEQPIDLFSGQRSLPPIDNSSLPAAAAVTVTPLTAFEADFDDFDDFIAPPAAQPQFSYSSTAAEIAPQSPQIDFFDHSLSATATVPPQLPSGGSGGIELLFDDFSVSTSTALPSVASPPANQSSNSLIDDFDFADFQSPTASAPPTAAPVPSSPAASTAIAAVAGPIDATALSCYESHRYRDSFLALERQRIQREISGLNREKAVAIENDDLDRAVELKHQVNALNSRLRELSSPLAEEEAISLRGMIEKSCRHRPQLIAAIEERYPLLPIIQSTADLSHNLSVIANCRRLLAVLPFLQGGGYYDCWHGCLEALYSQLTHCEAVLQRYRQQLTVSQRQEVLCDDRFRLFVKGTDRLLEAGRWLDHTWQHYYLPTGKQQQQYSFTFQWSDYRHLLERVSAVLLQEPSYRELCEVQYPVKDYLSRVALSSEVIYRSLTLPLPSSATTAAVDMRQFLEKMAAGAEELCFLTLQPIIKDQGKGSETIKTVKLDHLTCLTSVYNLSTKVGNMAAVKRQLNV